MNLSIGMPILCVLLMALLLETAHARPSDWFLSRQKRLSDQRLAELETLLALENVKGVRVPVGFGKVNPALFRQKRLSDQRLAEHETLIGLEKVKGYRLPVGLGIVNPALVRQKRLSDQRLAELGTLIGLENVKVPVTVPVGFGKVDLDRVGRKRRSISEDNLRKLHHLLLLIAQDAESTADQSDQIRPLPWKEAPREEQRDYQLI